MELYNPNLDSVDISGYLVETTNVSALVLAIPNETSIRARNFVKVTYIANWLDNVGENLVLKDASDLEIDRSQVLEDEHDNKRSRQRIPNGHDMDQISDWQFAPDTKGSANSSIPQ